MSTSTAGISKGHWKATELSEVDVLLVSADTKVVAIVPARTNPNARADAQFIADAAGQVQQSVTSNNELRQFLAHVVRTLDRLHAQVAHAAGIAEGAPGYYDLDYILDVITSHCRAQQHPHASSSEPGDEGPRS